jgi:hypothetical protein
LSAQGSYSLEASFSDSTNPDKAFDVICNATGFGIGAELMQDRKAIAYEGRKLADPESQYIGGDQELLAVHLRFAKMEVLPRGSCQGACDHRPCP